MTALALLVLVAALMLGDQREWRVTLARPGAGEEVPATVREVALTFDGEPDRSRVEEAFIIEPAAPGAFRWRGSTLIYAFSGTLDPGAYRVSIPAQTLGRGGEQLREPFELTFTVREPGLALVVSDGNQQELVEVRPGLEPRVLVAAPRIIDYAVSPDGTRVAAVVADAEGWGGLVLAPAGGGSARSLVQSPEITIGGVAWSPDGSALVVVRRDRLPSGDLGVPRTWLLRIGGEFAGEIDTGGSPSLNPAWSPDGQQLAYVSPSDARVVVTNLGTGETREVGQPRGGWPAWSPDSRLVAFESAPRSEGTSPLQPVRAVSLDGVFDRTFGEPGEVRSAPRFLDADTLVSLRRATGTGRTGTDLVFESVRDGSRLRAIQLTVGAGLVLRWDLDAAGKRVVYSVMTGGETEVVILDLESGDRETVTVTGEWAKWLP